MAEALSVAASVAGLVSLGLQTTEYLYKYYAACRDREQDLARTTDQLGDLLQYLRTIDEVIRTRKWRPDEKTILQNIEESISRSEDVIHELQVQVQKFQKGPTNTVSKKIQATGRWTTYPFKRSTLQKLDEDISEFRGNLSVALQALDLKEHQNTQNDLDEMKSILQTVQAQHLAAGVRQWLRAPDATVDYNVVSAKRHAGTGQWFVQGPAFTTWLQQDNSFLWLYGFAGCGKSVLCSTAIQHTFRQQRSQTGSAIAFFFFTFNDDYKQDASALLRALLLQLSGQITGVNAELTRLRDSSNHGTPPVPILLEYLRQAVTRSRHVYILLDALDECPTINSRPEVLATIQSMRQWSLPGLHLLVTSRDLPDIRDYLPSKDHTQDEKHVILKNDSVQEDIRNYVSYKVDHDPQLQRWGDHREKIKEHLTQHAGGVFRWVECQLRPLRHCARSVKHLEKCLRALPQSLDETYERMLCDIDVESRDDAQRILALLCHSARPLLASELIDALAVDLDDNECYDVDGKFESADDLLRICPGLIEINFTVRVNQFMDGDEDKDELNDHDKEDRQRQIIRIAHFSVQEYLVSDRIKRSRAAKFAISSPSEHVRISKTCLLYLCNEDFLRQVLTRDLVEQYPLSKFAAQYWYHHYKQAGNEFATSLSARAITLLTKSAMFDRWTRLHNPDRPWDTSITFATFIQNRPSATYCAALLGLESVLVGILSISQADINAQGGHYGSALSAASASGHEKVVQMLVDVGADVNAQGGDYGNALQAASLGGYEKVVQILVDAGADINAQGGFYGSALYAASYGGYEKVVQILVDAGADINAQGEEYGSALSAASEGGHEKVVQILVDAGADINAQGEEYGNALQAVSEGGHEKVVQMLVDAGADVNAQGGFYGSALYAASYCGHEKVVQILLDQGADINAQGAGLGNALQGASYGGHEKVVQILRQKQASSSSK